MRQFRGLCQPHQILVSIEACSWIPAFIAAIILSLLSSIAIVNSVGLDLLVAEARRVARVTRYDLGGVPLELSIYSVATIIMVVNLFVLVMVFYGALRTTTTVRYRKVLAICSYAAYVREMARLAITLVIASYCHFSHVRFTMLTNATAFLSAGPTGRTLSFLASSLDVFTLLFLILVTIGLWKCLPGLRPGRATALVFSSWLAYIGLGYCWRH